MQMHILITGAAGMIGRKLTARLVKDGKLNGKPIEQLTLIDVVAPQKPEGFAGKVEISAARSRATGAASKAIAGRPRNDLPSRRRGLGRSRNRFREGYHVNLDGRARCWKRSAPPAKATSESRIYLVDRGVRRTVPARDSRRISPHAAHLLRHAEGDQRIAARRLYPARHSRRRRHPPADICVRPGKPNKAASGFFSGIIREPLAGMEAVLPVADTVRHTHASPRSAVGISHSRGGPDAKTLGPRINLAMPGVCCTVAEQIEALRGSPATKWPRASAANPMSWSCASSPAGRAHRRQTRARAWL